MRGAAVACVALALIVPWMALPILGSFRADQLALDGIIQVADPVSAPTARWSFAAALVAIALLTALAAAGRRMRPWALTIGGSALVALSLFFVLSLVLLQPQLRQVSARAQQDAWDLKQVAGRPAAVSADRLMRTERQRRHDPYRLRAGLDACWFGPWLVFLGGALLGAAGWREGRRAGARRWTLAAAPVALAGLLAWMAVPAIAAQYHLRAAQLVLARGHPERVRAHWEAAGRWQPELQRLLGYHLLLGRAEILAGKQDDVLVEMTLSDREVDSRRPREAVVHARAARNRDPDSPGARLALAEALHLRALSAWRRRNYEGAGRDWSEVIQLDPTRLAPRLMGARTLLASHAYREAADRLETALPGVRDPVSRALVLADLAACYRGMNDEPQARRLYARSLRLVTRRNWIAWEGLNGR